VPWRAGGRHANLGSFTKQRSSRMNDWKSPTSGAKKPSPAEPSAARLKPCPSSRAFSRSLFSRALRSEGLPQASEICALRRPKPSKCAVERLNASHQVGKIKLCGAGLLVSFKSLSAFWHPVSCFRPPCWPSMEYPADRCRRHASVDKFMADPPRRSQAPPAALLYLQGRWLCARGCASHRHQLAKRDTGPPRERARPIDLMVTRGAEDTVNAILTSTQATLG
jgi:hypothetical protein